MKLQISPPTGRSTRDVHMVEVPEGMLGPSRVIEEVAAGYRYRRSLTAEVRRELIRFSALHWKPVFYALRGCMSPYPLFEREVTNLWLEGGGRCWIIAELETRSGKRVVPFVRKNGGDA
jgi:hypothetical protein